MRLVTFKVSSGAHVGALVADGIVDLTNAGVADTMLDLIAEGAAGLTKVRAALAGPHIPTASVELLAPIPQPGKVLCCGINYKSHADENPNAKMPSEPFFFAKVSSSVTGPESTIEAPAATKQLDYEVEFAAVIGKHLKRAQESDVMPALFGYTL